MFKFFSEWIFFSQNPKLPILDVIISVTQFGWFLKCQWPLAVLRFFGSQAGAAFVCLSVRLPGRPIIAHSGQKSFEGMSQASWINYDGIHRILPGCWWRDVSPILRVSWFISQSGRNSKTIRLFRAWVQEESKKQNKCVSTAPTNISRHQTIQSGLFMPSTTNEVWWKFSDNQQDWTAAAQNSSAKLLNCFSTFRLCQLVGRN